MKKLKIMSGLLLVMALLASSCSDDRDHNPTALEPTAFVLNEPVYSTANILLQKTSGISFTWSQPDYGVPVVATYAIQMSTEADFGDIPSVDDDGNDIMVSSVSTLQSGLNIVNTSISGKDINSVVLKNLMIDSSEKLADILSETGYVPVYLRATSTFNNQTILSNVVSIQTIPFFVEPESFSQYYIVGAMNGWSTGSANMWSLLYPSEEKNCYSYTTQWEGDGNLKIWELNDWGDWGKCWNTATDGDQSASGALIKGDNGAIKCPEPGTFYTFSINMNDFTYTWTKCENQSPTEFSSISLIGVNGDWEKDYDLIPSSPHNWYIKGYTFTAKTEFKFRADYGWTYNWGVELDVNDMPYGIGKQDGPNIVAPDGTFDIYFNDITGEFVFVKQ